VTGEEVVPLIISTIKRSKNIKQQEQQTEADLVEYDTPKEAYDERMIVYGIRILSVLSVVEAAKHQMAAYRSILEILVNVFKEDICNQARSDDALTLLKHLSTHTGEDYKLKLVRFPQLLQSIVQFKLHLVERGDVVNMLISLSSGENVRAKREAIKRYSWACVGDRKPSATYETLRGSGIFRACSDIKK
jgi:hypothetical protein